MNKFIYISDKYINIEKFKGCFLSINFNQEILKNLIINKSINFIGKKFIIIKFNEIVNLLNNLNNIFINDEIIFNKSKLKKYVKINKNDSFKKLNDKLLKIKNICNVELKYLSYKEYNEKQQIIINNTNNFKKIYLILLKIKKMVNLI